MTIADRIKEKRMELDLSQVALAKRMGYASRTVISRMELSGNDISLKMIEKTAKALGVTQSYLMGWDDEDVTYDIATLERINACKRLSATQQDYITRVIDLFIEADKSSLNVDCDVLEIFLKDERKRLEIKKRLVE